MSSPLVMQTPASDYSPQGQSERKAGALYNLCWKSARLLPKVNVYDGMLLPKDMLVQQRQSLEDKHHFPTDQLTNQASLKLQGHGAQCFQITWYGRGTLLSPNFIMPITTSCIERNYCLASSIRVQWPRTLLSLSTRLMASHSTTPALSHSIDRTFYSYRIECHEIKWIPKWKRVFI